jgi:hypothetical protein
MNILTNITLTYESLIPIPEPGNNYLSVGTITISNNWKLNLDFNLTETSWHPIKGSYVELHVTLSEFEPKSYGDDYMEMGLKPEDLTYDYFASILDASYVTEVYTEYCIQGTENCIPITLKKIQLHFADGQFLDYSDRISVFALNKLADVA